jgi:hypothetical protein
MNLLLLYFDDKIIIGNDVIALLDVMNLESFTINSLRILVSSATSCMCTYTCYTCTYYTTLYLYIKALIVHLEYKINYYFSQYL